MKQFKTLVALVLALMLTLSVASVAFAADPAPSTPSITIKASSTAAEGQTDTTAYTWYRIFEADIAADPTQSGATQTDGKVAYYVDSQDKATQIESTGLFTVTSNGAGRWYVELKDDSTTAATIAEKFAAMDLTAFPSGTFAQTAIAGTATSGTVDPGYYYITSTAGKEVVIQTLTAVTIDEKNEFPTVKKEIKPEDEDSEIGSIVTFTLTVNVPDTANDKIVLTDKMDAGLTFNAIASCKSNADGTPDVAYTLNPTAPAATDKTFTITFDASTVTSNQGKVITIEYKALVNKDAKIETDIPNEVKLAYGNNYVSVPSEAKTKTYKFDFDKVDGNNVKLAGAEFQLLKDGNPMDLVEVKEGEEYRVATSEDTTTTTTIKTTGKTITINGLDLDVTTYKLHETQAPTGFNPLGEDVSVTVEGNAFVHKDVINQAGSVLPSTGGIGTTIFYIAGAVLVLGAAAIVIARRKAEQH